MPTDRIGNAFQFLIVAGGDLLREEDDLIVGKILQHAQSNLVTQPMPAQISSALHKDDARPNPCRHGIAIVVLSRTLVGDGDTQLGEEPLLTEPNRVLAAIGRVREIYESGRAITRYQGRESITQLLGVKADKIACHTAVPGTTQFH